MYDERCGIRRRAHAQGAVRFVVVCVCLCLLVFDAGPVAGGTRLKAQSGRGPRPPAGCFPTKKCWPELSPGEIKLACLMYGVPESPTGADCQPFFATDTGLTNGEILITFAPDPTRPGEYVISGVHPLLVPVNTKPNECGFDDARRLMTFDGVPNTQYDVQNIRVSETGVFTFDLTFGANGALFNGESACLSAVGYPVAGFSDPRLGLAYAVRTNPLFNYAESVRAGVLNVGSSNGHPVVAVGNRIYTAQTGLELHEQPPLAGIPTDARITSVQFGRFNDDAFADIVVLTESPSPKDPALFTFLGNETGFTNAAPITGAFGRGLVASGNVVGDPTSEVLLFGTSLDIAVVVVNSSGQLSEIRSIGVGLVPESIAVASVTSDAVADILVSGHIDPQTIGVTLVEGGTLNPLRTVTVGCGGEGASSALVVGDFNNDGAVDAADYVISPGAACGPEPDAFYLLLNNPADPGHFSVQNVAVDLGTAAPLDSGPVVGPARGVCDLQAGLTVNGVTLLGDGAGHFQVADTPPVPSGSSLVSEVHGDFDGDGLPDAVRLIKNEAGELIVQTLQSPEVVPATRPEITKVKINKKGKLVVFGAGLVEGAEIVFNGARLPAGLKGGGAKLVSTSAAPSVPSGTSVDVQVILPDGTVSNGFVYTKP